MNACMIFPKTVDEFMEKYKIIDSKQIYTNGTELVPIFRMKQWFEHLSEDVQPVVRCKDCRLSEHDIDLTEYWCCYWDNKTFKNGYCSYGEWKDDEQNGSID